jgi:hypothetical protein
MQEQAFVTCVQSLTSRFSRISCENSPDQPAPPVPWRNHSQTPKVPSPEEEMLSLPHPPVAEDLHDSSEFPPPPNFDEELDYHSFSGNGYSEKHYAPEPAPPAVDLEQYSTLPRRPTNFGCEEHIMSSSSSSTESMPFANDNPNVATIKAQRVCSNNPSQVTTPVRELPLSSVMSAPPSVATSPSSTLMWPRKQFKLSLLSPSSQPSTGRPNAANHQVAVHSSPTSTFSPPVINKGWEGGLSFSPDDSQRSSGGDVIEDIETMLANLSNQLDAMLEKKD